MGELIWEGAAFPNPSAKEVPSLEPVSIKARSRQSRGRLEQGQRQRQGKTALKDTGAIGEGMRVRPRIVEDYEGEHGKYSTKNT